MRPLALYRLPGLTPVTFFSLSILVMFLITDLLLFGVDPYTRAILNGDGTPDARAVLWRMSLDWAVAVGFAVSVMRGQLENTMLSWMLPGVRRDLVVGALLAAIPLALVFALLAARIAPADFAIAVFALSLFWFAVPGFLIDLATPMLGRFAAVGALAWAVFAGPAYVRMVEAHPVLTGRIALALAVGMFWLVQAPHAARVRPISVLRMRQAGGPRWLIWLLGVDARKEWSTSLTTPQLLPWLRAAAHETTPPFPIGTVLVAVASVLYARLLNQPLALVWGALVCLPNAHLQLRKEVLYPLSRARRAELAHAATVVSALAFSAAAAVALVVSTRFSVALGDATRSPLGWYLAPVIIALFAPIAQWVTVRSPGAPGSRGLASYFIRAMPSFLFFFLLTGGSIHLLADPRRSAGASAMIVVIVTMLGAATHLIHWIRLPRFFASADLGDRWSPP